MPCRNDELASAAPKFEQKSIAGFGEHAVGLRRLNSRGCAGPSPNSVASTQFFHPDLEAEREL